MTLTFTEPPGPDVQPGPDRHRTGSRKLPLAPPPAAARRASGPHRAAASHQTSGHRRDPAIDLVRFACLIVVVILHSMMSAAVLGPGGDVVPTVALSGTIGFAAASWFFQVMPLFFVIGGCAGIIGWRRTRAKGGTWADYLRARLRRLVVPVTVLIAVAGLGLSVAAELGAPPELIAEASRRIGQPLWFLAVYVGLTALVPLAVHFHERSPRWSLAVLTTAVIVVDGLVAMTGVHGLGYLNFLFVWPLVQQLGFFYADSLDRPVPRPRTWTVLVTALAALAALVASGVYSPNMLVNLNPPTGALVLLGIAQMCALRLFHAWLNRMLTVGDRGAITGAGESTVNGATVANDGATGADHFAEAAPGPRIIRAQIWGRIIDWGNRYGMHVYLWHMSVVIVLIGGLGALAQLLSEVPGLAEFVLPAIGSGWWWGSRPMWLVVVMGLSALVAMGASRIPFPSERRLASVGASIAGLISEMRGNPAESAGQAPGVPGQFRDTSLSPRARGAIAIAAATVGIAIALLIGIAPLIWTVVALGLLMGSLIIAAGLGAGIGPTSGTGPTPKAGLTPRAESAGR
jgi:hypothetical protein